MKLFENVEGFDGSITDAIIKIAEEMFDQDLSETQASEIVGELKLSDILLLDAAYDNDDKETVAKLLGLEVDKLDEYSMGSQSTSAASNRPAPGRRDAPETSGTDNNGSSSSTKTNRTYSGNNRPAVTTNNIVGDSDDEASSDEVMQDDTVNETNVIRLHEWLQHKAGIK